MSESDPHPASAIQLPPRWLRGNFVTTGLLCFLACCSIPKGSLAQSVRPDEVKDTLKDRADIVVVGTVSFVESRSYSTLDGKTDSSKRRPVGDTRATTSIVIDLESVEKGRLISAKQQKLGSLSVTWESIVSAGVVFPHVSQGDRCRFYLQRGERGQTWSPLYFRWGSGIEILERAAKVPETATDQSAKVAEAPPSIETLWVSDQISGLLGRWMRSQQCYLVSDVAVSYQGIDLKVGRGSQVEIFSAEYPIVSHRKNRHGGIIELGPASGDLLTVSEEPDENDQMVPTLRTVEHFDREDGSPNFFLAYRWLAGGRIDFVDFLPEEDADGTLLPLDREAILDSLSDPNAFSKYRWIDEESLLPGDPPFISLSELRAMGGALTTFSNDDDTAHQKVSDALDALWKKPSPESTPDHLGGVGMFADSYRFARVFPQAMVEAGFHPIFGVFDFARAHDFAAFGGELSRDEQAAMGAKFDSQEEFFEESLRKWIEDEGTPAKLREFSKEPDQKRRSESDVVLIGSVIEVKIESVRNGKPGGARDVHTLTIRPESVEKGASLVSDEKGFQIVTVRWTDYLSAAPGDRISAPQKGDRCRFFLEKSEENLWVPVMPGGIETL